MHQVRHHHLAAALQPVDTDTAHGRKRMQNEADHRPGAEPLHESHGAETPARRRGEDGRDAVDDTLLMHETFH